MADILDAYKQGSVETATVNTGKKLRIGIIGTGGIANSHIKSYLVQPDVEVVAGADLIPGKAEAFFKRYNVEAQSFTDYKEMLEKVELDAVSVCTYNRTHAECTIACLEKGIPVLLEKPFTVTLDEAIEVCKAEKKYGKIVSVGFQPRFDENMKMIKKIVQSGELGDIYYIQTGGGRRHGIPVGWSTTFIEEDKAGLGALADIGCYSLDMCLNAIGYPKPLTVSGIKTGFFGKTPEAYKSSKYTVDPEKTAALFGVDDWASAFIRLEGGIILDFRISWYMHLDTPGDTIIMGTKGSLRIPSTDCWNGTVGGAMTIYKDVSGEPTKVTVPLVQNPAGSNFDRKIRSFLDAVINGTEAPIPTSQILYNQAILDGIAKSSDLGKEVEIEIPEV